MFGTWRSSVARTLGVGEVAGSNPVVPTIIVYVTSRNETRCFFIYTWIIGQHCKKQFFLMKFVVQFWFFLIHEVDFILYG